MFTFIMHRQGSTAINSNIFNDVDSRPLHLVSYFRQEVIYKHEYVALPPYKEFSIDLFTGSKSHIVLKRFINLTDIVSNFTL